MFDDLLLNPDTRERLELYLRIPAATAPSLVLAGENGLGKRTVGDEIGKFLLNYGGALIDKHPDFLRVNPEGGKISKGQADTVRAFTNIHTSIAPRRVILIDDAECMGDSAANSLLKTLEDGAQTCVFIFVAHKPLLPTINSRCAFISFSIMEDHELKNSMPSDVNDIVLAASDGRIGRYYMLQEDTDFQKQADKIVHTLNTMTHPRALLLVCHAMMEKDKDYLFEVFSSEQCQGLYALLMAIFRHHLLHLNQGGEELTFINAENLCHFYDSQKTVKILKQLKRAQYLSGKKGRFSKNDFFELLTFFIN